MNLRVVGSVRGRARPDAAGEHEPTAPRRHRVRWRGRWIDARLATRGELPQRGKLQGPLVVTEMSATTFVPPGWTARVLDTGDLLLEPVSAARSEARRRKR